MAIFWKREKDQTTSQNLLEPAPAGAQDPGAGSLLEQSALDELAALLRIWGQHAFDLEEVKAADIGDQLDRWAKHVLLATPAGQRDSGHSASDRPAGRRDWAGLREFSARIRRSEQAYVNRQVLGARQVMGDFVQTLGQVLAEDQDEQSRVLSAIHHLRDAIEGNAPVEVLSKTAVQAIDLISGIAQERTQRHRVLLRDLTNKLQTLRGELDIAQREMELDPLTRLYNRKAFDEQLERVFELCCLSGQPACLLIADADHFKSVNDDFGHPVGDLVLKRLADCCVQGFPRKSDFVSRYGGEEFAVILQDTTSATGLQLGQRLLETIRACEIAHDEGILRITVSIGIADLDPNGTPGQWLRAADNALYQAKRAGRDRVVAQRSNR